MLSPHYGRDTNISVSACEITHFNVVTQVFNLLLANLPTGWRLALQSFQPYSEEAVVYDVSSLR